MDFLDFFSDTAEVGAAGRGWRSVFAVLALVIGAGLGLWTGFAVGGLPGAVSGAATGALLGWFVAVFLRGLALVVGLTVLLVALGAGWAWMAGAFAGG